MEIQPPAMAQVKEEEENPLSDIWDPGLAGVWQGRGGGINLNPIKVVEVWVGTQIL